MLYKRGMKRIGGKKKWFRRKLSQIRILVNQMQITDMIQAQSMSEQIGCNHLEKTLLVRI